jgi:hypothetical protein
MDRQERHQQDKQKAREEKNRAEKAYEEEQQKRRLPLHPLWYALGTAMVLVVIYVWTVGIW